MFTLELDRPKRRLEIRLSGFWDLPEMERFADELVLSLRQLKQIGGWRSCLVDGTAYPVQSRQIADRHQQLLSNLGDLQADRIAVVQPAQLVKIQVTRTAGAVQYRVFASRAEALAWLDGEDALSGSPADH